MWSGWLGLATILGGKWEKCAPIWLIVGRDAVVEDVYYFDSYLSLPQGSKHPPSLAKKRREKDGAPAVPLLLIQV